MNQWGEIGAEYRPLIRWGYTQYKEASGRFQDEADRKKPRVSTSQKITIDPRERIERGRQGNKLVRWNGRASPWTRWALAACVHGNGMVCWERCADQIPVPVLPLPRTQRDFWTSSTRPVGSLGLRPTPRRKFPYPLKFPSPRRYELIGSHARDKWGFITQGLTFWSFLE